MIETECTVVYHKPLNEIKAIIVKYQLPCTLNSDLNHTPISMTNITTRLASGEIAVDQYTPVEYGGQNSFSIAYVQDLHEQWALNSHEWYQDTHESAMTLSEYEEKCYQESIIALFEFLVLCYNKNVDILYCEGRAFTTKGPNGKLDIGTFAGCYLDKACLSVIDQASANGVWQIGSTTLQSGNILRKGCDKQQLRNAMTARQSLSSASTLRQIGWRPIRLLSLFFIAILVAIP